MERDNGRGSAMASRPLRLRRLGLAGALTAALTLSGSALAAGKPVNIGTPFDSGRPAVAVDNAGDAVIAWANTKDLAGASNFVQYCVLPVGATACSESGNLHPADSAAYIDNVQVLDDGSTLVILADVYGAAGSNAGDYEPEQEWQSSDGGATFSIVDGGLSVASGIIDADTVPLGAVTLPGTGVLGYGWETAGSEPPTFNAFALSGPPECSVASCATGHASLSPPTNPDQLGNGGGNFASEAGSDPGVMGVFFTDFSNGPLGCAKGFGTAYAYGSGNQSASNSYNVSPGSPNSAWKVAVAQADCNVEYSAVGGGPSGFGVLEDNEANGTTVYQRFDQAHAKFDTPPVTVASTGEQQPALSQDAAGGVYGTDLLGGSGGPAKLSYSSDGGKTWASGTLDANKDGGINNLNSSVNGPGQGWASWTDNGSVYAQSFSAVDAISPASVGGGATTNGTTVTVIVSCASFPCTITLTLTAPETVVVHAAAARVSKKKNKTRTKTITLGKGRFTIKSKGAKKLSIRLSGPGKRFLRSRTGHIKISGLISTDIEHHTTKTKRSLTLTIKPPKKVHRKK